MLLVNKVLSIEKEMEGHFLNVVCAVYSGSWLILESFWQKYVIYLTVCLYILAWTSVCVCVLVCLCVGVWVCVCVCHKSVVGVDSSENRHDWNGPRGVEEGGERGGGGGERGGRRGGKDSLAVRDQLQDCKHPLTTTTTPNWLFWNGWAMGVPPPPLPSFPLHVSCWAG